MPVPQVWAFIRQYFVGFVLIFLGYMIICAFRNYREYFATDIYAKAIRNQQLQSWHYVALECPSTVFVFVAIAVVSRSSSNRKGLLLVQALVMTGALICTVPTLIRVDFPLSGIHIASISNRLLPATQIASISVWTLPRQESTVQLDLCGSVLIRARLHSVQYALDMTKSIILHKAGNHINRIKHIYSKQFTYNLETRHQSPKKLGAILNNMTERLVRVGCGTLPIVHTVQ